MTDIAVTNVSPHVLADVATCETKSWARHIKGYTTPGEAIKAIAGQAIHAATATYLDPRVTPTPRADLALQALHRVYDDAWARCPADKLPDTSYLPSNLHRIMDRWIALHPPVALPWKRVLAVETAFESRRFVITRSDGIKHIVRLIVRPDAIVEAHDGSIRWLDTKTTGWRISDPGWKAELRMSLQIALYTDAVIQQYGPQGYLGGWVNAVEIRKLPDSNGKCKEHKGLLYAECGNEHAKIEIIEEPLSEERIAAAVADARRASARVVEMADIIDTTELNMYGSANRACHFCPALAWCEANRLPDSLDGFMIYDPWVVEEGERAA